MKHDVGSRERREDGFLVILIIIHIICTMEVIILLIIKNFNKGVVLLVLLLLLLRCNWNGLCSGHVDVVGGVVICVPLLLLFKAIHVKHISVEAE